EITLSLNEVSQPGNTTLAWKGADPLRDTPDEGIQYAWRLDGSEWSPYSHGKSRIFELLPSGKHTFEVKARDRDFNEDPTPASVTFTVVPPVWQEPWFIGLMVVLLGAIGFQTGRVLRRDRLLQVGNKALSDANKELFGLNRDLQQQAVVLERDRAVERIRAEVQSMAQASDFEKVLSLLVDDLKTVGLSFDTCGIDALAEPVEQPSMAHFEEHGFRYTTYTIDPGGNVVSESYDVPAPFQPVSREMIERFTAGEPWRGSSEGTTILEVPAGAYGRLRLTSSGQSAYSEDEAAALQEFATAVALGYSRFFDLKSVEEAQQRTIDELEDELQTAHDMQMALMPTEHPQVEGFDIAGRCVPATQVGGDYFQYLDVEGHLGVVLADATGHAMEAAMPVVMFSGILKEPDGTGRYAARAY
ncbi:MAG: triple tyrosine motif-containing protein, partial [Candidatus Latescibacteria bacterium]|nr:triple tyrosine motif-containing protein [Candidatus Latescibacterota bacterium]